MPCLLAGPWAEHANDPLRDAPCALLMPLCGGTKFVAVGRCDRILLGRHDGPLTDLVLPAAGGG